MAEDSAYNILITGASGLVGQALEPLLERAGHRLFKLSRSSNPEALADWQWCPEEGAVRLGDATIDAVVHLAGANIAGGRWSSTRKKRLTSSRTVATQALCEALVGSGRVAPKVFVSASGVGFYGDGGDGVLREDSPQGEGFLASLAQRWEEASSLLAAHGTRLVHARLGMVLSPKGGALAKMTPPFRFGLGGRLGPGSQYWSWIAHEDAVGFFAQAVEDARFRGAFNVVAPDLVTNREFTRALARALKRPVGPPLPSWAVRAIFGLMGQEVFLASTRAEPAKLLDLNFSYQRPKLGDLLTSLFQRRS